MEKEITLKSVVRREFASGKKVIVTADDANGVEKELSAYQEAWNDGWQPGDTVTVVIKPREHNGKTYYNLYPSAKEANTARPPAPKPAETQLDRIEALCHRVLNALASQPVKSPIDPFDPDNIADDGTRVGGGHF
jgi:hypothetical protein